MTAAEELTADSWRLSTYQESLGTSLGKVWLMNLAQARS